MSSDTAGRGGRAKPARAEGVGKPESPRREFLRGVARVAALGGLGAAGAVLASRASSARRARRAGGAGGGCAGRGVCPSCGEVAGCPLPQAELTRRARRAR